MRTRGVKKTLSFTNTIFDQPIQKIQKRKKPKTSPQPSEELWTTSVREKATQKINSILRAKRRDIQQQELEISCLQELIEACLDMKDNAATIRQMRELLQLELQIEHDREIYKNLTALLGQVSTSEVPIDYCAQISSILDTPIRQSDVSKDSDSELLAVAEHMVQCLAAL